MALIECRINFCPLSTPQRSTSAIQKNTLKNSPPPPPSHRSNAFSGCPRRKTAVFFFTMIPPFSPSYTSGRRRPSQPYPATLCSLNRPGPSRSCCNRRNRHAYRPPGRRTSIPQHLLRNNTHKDKQHPDPVRSGTVQSGPSSDKALFLQSQRFNNNALSPRWKRRQRCMPLPLWLVRSAYLYRRQ